jgi:hypothetical protein
MQTRATEVGSTSESRWLGRRRSRAMIRGREPGMKASIKLLQYVFALIISSAGLATMIVILHHALR